ncbi:MAG: hypothetical protein PHN88_02775 [Ignavibacteria bacterium]|nr:hypothetical protein [Ignavibacteria bacterium]
MFDFLETGDKNRQYYYYRYPSEFMIEKSFSNPNKITYKVIQGTNAEKEYPGISEIITENGKIIEMNTIEQPRWINDNVINMYDETGEVIFQVTR